MTNYKKIVCPCPDNIVVIGGGRWARVHTEVLCNLIPLSVGIFIHSPRNAEAMSSWVSGRRFRHRIQVSSKWPQLDFLKLNAMIVVNAARDHERAIELALSVGSPVLVEKPVTLTTAASQRLASLAFSRGVCFASAHVLLFTRYLENFSNLISTAGNIESVRMCWMDPKIEIRYGEHKQYDSSLPVFVDVLPHVLSSIGILLPNLPKRCETLEFMMGGAHLKLNLKYGDIPCGVELCRNGDLRQRVLEVTTTHQTFKLDFSEEPGIIIAGSSITNGDPHWEVKMRPVAQMLTAFLQWAGGGEFDSRLSIEVGLGANQVIDEIYNMYNEALEPWLIAKLSSLDRVDEDLRYALNEILLANERFSEAEIESQIERVQKFFSGDVTTELLKALKSSHDPIKFVGSIAREAIFDK
jgi:predicted dehydrogenase